MIDRLVLVSDSLAELLSRTNIQGQPLPTLSGAPQLPLSAPDGFRELEAWLQTDSNFVKIVCVNQSNNFWLPHCLKITVYFH